MASDDKNIYEKIWYDVKREAAKISGLSSGKIDKYEHLTSEEIFPSDHIIIIEQAKFIWKKNDNNWRTRKKAIWSFRSFKT